MSVVADRPAWAAPGGEPGLLTPAPRPPAGGSRRPGEGLLLGIQRTRTAAAAAAARAAPAATSAPSSQPWVEGIFPRRAGRRPRRRRRDWCAGRRAEAAAARLAATPFLSLPPLPRLPGPLAPAPWAPRGAPVPAARRRTLAAEARPIWRPATPPPARARARSRPLPSPPRPRPSPRAERARSAAAPSGAEALEGARAAAPP